MTDDFYSSRAERYCLKCRQPCGTLLVCEPCRRRLTPHEFNQITILLHQIVRSEHTDPETGLCRCHHCKEPFAPEFICADHFPVTKGSDETKRFDLAAVVPSDAGCNTSGTRDRQKSIAKIDRGLCVKCRRFLAVRDGLCLRC
jgi:hypothetical protein